MSVYNGSVVRSIGGILGKKVGVGGRLLRLTVKGSNIDLFHFYFYQFQ